MAVALDATVGGPSANSYIDVAGADGLIPFVASKARSDAWIKLVEDVKATYLIRAVKILETYIDFDGIRVQDTQPLDWPRDWVYGPDHFWALPATEIPGPVKEAQCLMALNLSEGFDPDVSGASPLVKLQISTLHMQFDQSRSARGALLVPAEVVEKLRGFGDYVGASGMGRAIQMVRG